ncbi:MAG: glycosyltransferase [Bacteroidetes bacterium]|nr:glycosyltransferase [Bacteroidota bacterium]
MNLSIIIVNYNLIDEIVNLLMSIKIPAVIGYEIILIDNSSESHVNEYWNINKSKFANLHYYPSNNSGFGSACNYGVKLAKYDNLLFLNPDAIITKWPLIEMLNDLEEKKDIIVPIIMNRKKIINNGNIKLNIISLLLDLVFMQRFIDNNIIKIKNKYQNKKYIALNWFSGAAFVIKRKLFLEVGGFNEKYFLYYEDVYLSFILIELRKNIGINTNWIIEHYESTTTKKNYFNYTYNYYKSKNMYYSMIYRKNKFKIAISKLLLSINIYEMIILFCFLYPFGRIKYSSKIKALIKVK